MFRHISITICFTIFGLCGYTQLPQFSFSQLDSLQKTEPRKVVVFIHTDWCKYCRAMEETTFKNREIVKSLSTEFYFVTLNAEEKTDINFNGHVFKFKPTGNGTGTHELAEQLGIVNGTLTFPALSFLNEKNDIIYQQVDYISDSDLKKILKQLQ